MKAVQGNQEEAAKMLLYLGAQAEQRNKQGLSVFDMAKLAGSENRELMALLEKADLN